MAHSTLAPVKPSAATTKRTRVERMRVDSGPSVLHHPAGVPAMLSSVAEFYEDDVSTRVTAMLSLVEPAIMICMGIFVAFVLVSLYLPIFSLADSFHP